MIESKTLGSAAGIQYQDVIDKSEGTDLPSLANGVITGRFKRGYTGKVFTVTADSYKTVLGHDPSNPSYMAVVDLFSRGVSEIKILRIGVTGKVTAPDIPWTELEPSTPIKPQLSGFLLLAHADVGTTYKPRYDKTATSEPTWKEYFSQTIDYANIAYERGDRATYATVTATAPAKIIDLFDLDWTLRVHASNGYFITDTYDWTFEILDENNSVLAAVKGAKTADFSTGIWYGKSLTSLVQTEQVGENQGTDGDLTFTKSRLIYSNRRASNYNSSFTLDVDLTAAKKIRVSGKAVAANTILNSGTAGGYIRIEPSLTLPNYLLAGKGNNAIKYAVEILVGVGTEWKIDNEGRQISYTPLDAQPTKYIPIDDIAAQVRANAADGHAASQQAVADSEE